MPNYILTSARNHKTFLSGLIFPIRKNTTSRPRVNCQPNHRCRALSAEVRVSLHSSIYSQLLAQKFSAKILFKTRKISIFQFFIIFLTPMKNLKPASLPSIFEFRKLILSQNKLPYKIQFLRKSQLETIRLFSTIDFYPYPKIPTSRHRVNCQPSHRCRALSAEVHVTPPCSIKFRFFQ